MTFRAVVACALVPLSLVLLAADPLPAPPPPAAADNVALLAGTWTCRSADRETIHQTGTRDGDVISVRDGVQPDRGRASERRSRYEFDPAHGRWAVAFAPGTEFAVTGAAAPWTGDRWVVDGRGKDGSPARIVFEKLPGNDVRRTYFYGNYAQKPEGEPRLAERCSPGDAPPPASACIVEELPVTTIFAAPVLESMLPNSAPNGMVNVTVSLDADSRIVGTRIYSTTSLSLNSVAQLLARRSVFRTAVRNCKPVPSEGIMGFTF